MSFSVAFRSPLRGNVIAAIWQGFVRLPWEVLVAADCEQKQALTRRSTVEVWSSEGSNKVHGSLIDRRLDAAG